MTHRLLAICSTALMLTATAAPVNVLTSAEHIACKNGTIQLSKVVKTLFEDDFKAANASKWEPFINYEDRIATRYGEHLGTAGFILTKNPAQTGTDTAYEMVSKPFAVTPSSTFTFTIAARGSIDMYRARGHKDLYHNHIVWLDKDGQPLETPFAYKYHVRYKNVTETKITGTIPAQATQAVIHIGADSPNITAESFVCYTHVAFESEEKDSKYWTTGEFISRPFYTPSGSIITKADTPVGTSWKLLVSCAPDANGVPGTWSDFTTSILPLPQPWMRYKIILTGTADATPVIRQVAIGNILDNNWSGVDKSAPDITKLLPSLTQDAAQPIMFKIEDQLAVDWTTVRIWLDGQDIIQQCKRQGNLVTFTPAVPLQPVKNDFTQVNSWNLVNNFKNAIQYFPCNDRGNAARVTRELPQVDSSFTVKSPALSIKGGNEYTLSMDVHSNLAFERTQLKNAPLKCIWTDAQGKTVGEPVRCYFDDNAPDWKSYSFKLTAPETATQLFVTVGFDTPNIYENSYFDFANPRLEGQGLSDITADKPNFHTFQVAARDLNGNSVVRNFIHLIAPTPQTAPKATIRQDGAILIDDKPFFPIGLYAVCQREFNNNSFDKAFADLKAGGFNTAHTYGSGRGPVFSDFLATAAKYGFKLYIASNSGANNMDINSYLKDVINERNHPAVLSWYLADDTADHVGEDDLKALHDAIHEIDHAHLTSQADPVGDPNSSRYRDYVHSTDIFLPEIYPVKKDVASEIAVPTVIRDMKTIQEDLKANGSPAKSIWPIIQYFDGWGAWERFPTYDELHAMSFLSIIHGGNGITWYTYGGFDKNHGVTATPETWANICKVATELNQLSDIFLTECHETGYSLKITEGQPKDALGYDSISVLYKRVGGKQYLICANSAKAEVKAAFTVRGAATANVWFENRSLTLADNTFGDTFAPYAVHVYELQP